MADTVSAPSVGVPWNAWDRWNPLLPTNCRVDGVVTDRDLITRSGSLAPSLCGVSAASVVWVIVV